MKIFVPNNTIRGARVFYINFPTEQIYRWLYETTEDVLPVKR